MAEPRIDLAEWLRLQGVEAALPIRPHRDEPRLVEDAEVPRHAGLMDTGLLDDVTNLVLAMAKGLDDATARRIGECLEDGELHYYADTLTRIYWSMWQLLRTPPRHAR